MAGNSNFGIVDALKYTYQDANPNMLSSITDTEEAEKGFKGTTANYTYDDSGNMTYASNKSLSTAYSFHDLPLQMNTPNGKVLNYYTSSGIKLKSVILPSESSINEGPTITNYFDNIEYENSKVKAVYFAEGRAVTSKEGPYVEYFLKDHLGNTRVRIADTNADNHVLYNVNNPEDDEVMSSHHYYPYGMEWDLPTYDYMGNSLASTGKRTKYTYNGNERIDDLNIGLNDFNARWYDPAIGRFTSVDPLAEYAPDWTSFRFGFNNPITYSDPFGLFETKAAAKAYAKENGIKTGWFRNSKIVQNSDGTWSIDNKKEHSSISDLGGDLGVQTGALKTEVAKNVGNSSNMATFRVDQNYAIDDYHSNGINSYIYTQIGIANRDIPADFANHFMFARFSKAPNLVKIGESADDVITFSSKLGTETVEGIANVKVVGDKLYLNGLHLEGSSGGAVGRANMWKMAKDLGRQYNAKEVIIQGGRRTTGKYKGQVPSPVRIKVD